VWDYATHPSLSAVFPQRVQDLVLGIYSKKYNTANTCADVRPIHKDLFNSLTPTGHPYYAGHFRGESGCLVGYEVHISAPNPLEEDPLVGRHSSFVPHEMARFAKLLVRRVGEMANLQRGAILMDPGYRMAVTVRFACQAFVEILTIHPFVNGNGHVARALLWIILFHFGYAVPLWTIDPRPAFPDYSSMIAAHRRGNVELIERFVISTLEVV
jgi:fido (protein-threonine AMPylation protein)